MAKLKNAGIPAPLSGDGTESYAIPPHPPGLAHGAVPGPPIWHGANMLYTNVPMWSTYRFVPSGKDIPDNVRLFSASIGQYGQGFGHGHALDICDTNAKEQGQIYANMEVTAVSWDVWGCERDRRHIYDTGTWSWDFVAVRCSGSPFSGFRSISGDGGVLGADGHLRSYYEYEAGAFLLPIGTSFNILLQLDKSYRFRDECFVRFFIYGKQTAALGLAETLRNLSTDDLIKEMARRKEG